MKTKLIFTAILLIAFVFTGCEKSNDEIMEDVTSIQKKKPKERPFKSSGTTYAVGGGDQCVKNDGTNGFTFEYAGEGKATHMGKITLTGEHCLAAGCADGLVTFVAANGDELYNAYENLCVIDGSNPPYVLIEGWGTFESGTGRFEDAEGSIYWILILDTSDNTSTWEANGTITY